MASLEKYKDQAKKFEQKEQWAKAIEVLVRAIEEFEKSPEDDTELPLYTRAADAYLKAGDTTNAITYYERAADRYADAGLVNQAIALCNKVQRLSPGRASVFLKLGILFARKGFAAEAKQNLLEYAGRMQKAGQIEEAFKALKKFAEMTPGQDEVWTVLAQQARAQATTKEAKEQVEKLIAEFEAKEKVATQRKSRMSRSMVTGEVIAEEKPKKGELIFLDVDEVPTPRRSAATRPSAEAPAPPPPPPPPPPPQVSAEPLVIESTSLVEPAAVTPPEAAGLPLLGVEPTALVVEPTSLGIEPTSLAEPPAAAAAEPAAEAEPIPEPIPEPEPVREPAPEYVEPTAGLPLLEEEPVAEAPAAAMAGLPMLEVEEPAAPAAETPAAAEAPLDLTFEELPAAAAAEPVAEAEVAQSLEFLDLGEVVATAPTLDELEARVAANPEDWEGHRLLGEALLEAGDRERGVAELDASLAGYDQVEDLESAYAVAEEILRLDPNSVRHQQKRVELAYRQGDRARLVDSYLELADALLRSNDAEKSLAVYQRVLEHDPENVRARSAVETLAPPAPPEPVAPARTTRAPAAPAAAPGEYVDLGAFLLEEEEAPKDTRMRIQDEEPTGDEQLDFQQMLAAFKRGIEANVGEEDFQSHYDLGVAYKEMGLLDEAIAEFQKALRATEGRLKSSEALGLCFFEKGQYAIAETILRRGLELPATGDAERIGLLYWLGRTLEEQQKAPDALAAYNRVFAVDINFADVNQRVAALAGD